MNSLFAELLITMSLSVLSGLSSTVHKGIGRKLFDYAYANQIADKITVNSSSYAVRFYESLGFSKINEKQETDGLKYTPMIKCTSSLKAEKQVLE